jgi:hypothetical protein
VRSSDDVSLPIAVRGEATRDFNTLFDSFYVRLARLLYRITGDFGRAEEMASEASGGCTVSLPLSLQISKAGSIEPGSGSRWTKSRRSGGGLAMKVSARFSGLPQAQSRSWNESKNGRVSGERSAHSRRTKSP